MNEKEMNQFKEDLKNYRFLKTTVDSIKDEIEVLFYQETGVKGISFDKVHTSVNERYAQIKRLETIDKIEDLEKKLVEPSKRLKDIEDVLQQMSYYDRNIFNLKYLDGLSFNEIAKRYFISKAGIFYRMNEALRKIEIKGSSYESNISN